MPFFNFTGGGSSTPAPSGGGFDFSSIAGLAGQLGGGSSSSGSASSGGSGGASSILGGLASGAGMGATIGTIIPGVGNVVGGIVGGLLGVAGGLLGGHGEPDHEASDRGRIAATNHILDQQAADVCGFEESHSPRNYDDIVKQAANDNSYFLQLVAKYNQAHPSTPVIPGSASGSAPAVSASLNGGSSGLLAQNYNSLLSGGNVSLSSLSSMLSGLNLQQNSPVPQSSSLTSQDLKNAASAAYNGAVKSAADSLMQTPEGKAATKAGAEQFVKDNGWWLAPVGLVAGFGLYKAATK